MRNKKVKVSICISQGLYDEIEKLREVKTGHSVIIYDRSTIFEQILVNGINYVTMKNDIAMNSVDVMKTLGSLNIDLDKVDLTKLNIEKLLSKSTG